MSMRSIRPGGTAVLAAALLAAAVLGPTNQSPAEATVTDCASVHGTTEPTKVGDDYIIDDVKKLVWLSVDANWEAVVSGSERWREQRFLQTEDIELAGCLFAGLGSTLSGANNAWAQPFDGVYDGGGHTISDLVMDRGSAQFTGLFLYVGDAGIISDVHIVNADVKGGSDTGALAGSVDRQGRVEDSSVSGVVTVSGATRTGGLVGNAEGNIRRSEVTGTVTVTGGRAVGGLAGRAGFPGEIRGSTVSGTVQITGDNRVGGLVGEFTDTPVVGASVSGSVSVVAADRYAGGLLGQATGSDASIGRSFSTASVQGFRDVGGLIGELGTDVAVRSSFASGDVTGIGDGTRENFGGLIGKGSGPISDSYSTGRVSAGASAVNTTRFGGLVGWFATPDDAISTSFAVGAVTVGTGTATDTGGLVGAGGNPSTQPAPTAFWNTQTTLQSASLIGTAGDNITLRDLATFTGAGWKIVDGWEEFDPDNDKVWGICPALNDGYPFLLWEYTEEQVPVACGGTFVPTVERTDTPAGASTPVLASGALPTVTSGSGVWQQADGTTVPLSASSPGANQVRYSADGVTVTFTGGAGTSVSNGLVANPAGEVACEVCLDLATGDVIEVWMFSTPRLVAAHRIDAEPCQRFTVPVVAPLDGGGAVSAGAHTLQLALPTASGMQAVNVGVTVGGPVPASVPAGEGPTVPVGLLALGLFAAAGAVVAARRQVVTG